jgi:hypothetical protein
VVVAWPAGSLFPSQSKLQGGPVSSPSIGSPSAPRHQALADVWPLGMVGSRRRRTAVEATLRPHTAKTGWAATASAY